jgi:hypothetical protein
MNNMQMNKREYEAQLMKRWGWLTEDISDRDSLINTHLMLENSYKLMVEQKAVPRGWLEDTVLAEDTLTEAPQRSTAVGDYVIPRVMFPVIRRVMPELIANKLVAVQPIQAPAGVIYYITYQYSNSKGEITRGDEFSGNPSQTAPSHATFYTSEKIGPYNVTVDESDASYDEGSHLITINTGTSITDFLGTSIAPSSGIDNNPALKSGSHHQGTRIKRLEVFNIDTGRTIPVILQIKGGQVIDGATASYDPKTGTIELNTNASSDDLVGVNSNSKSYPINPGNRLRVFLTYDQEGTDKIPEMEFFIDYMSISTTERKLRVRWTKESEQDMQAYHKIDVESELVKVAAIQTNYEIDRELMKFIDDTIIPRLSFAHDWSNDGSGPGGNNTRGNYLDRHRALAQKMYFAATQIAAYNRMGPAQWAVVSPQIASLFMMLPDWKSGEISGNKSTFYNAGFLGNGTLTVYVDPNRIGPQANEVTMGYKPSDSTYGAGIVYSPYANWMSSTITHPDTFDSIRGFFSRYALTRVLRSEYNYSRISIFNYFET